MPNHPKLDPRELPRFTIREAALDLGIPASTLRSWVRGRTYPHQHGQTRSAPVIQPAGTGDGLALSFYNLAEAHVLSALRREHQIKLPKIRAAVHWLRQREPSRHPLLSPFLTDGVDLFVEHLAPRPARSRPQTVNASRGGQLGIDAVLRLYLQRLETDQDGKLCKIFPAILGASSPKIISLTYNIAAGRPIVDGFGVQASVLWNRHQAGESIATLAADYGLPPRKVQAALEYHSALTRAAA